MNVNYFVLSFRHVFNYCNVLSTEYVCHKLGAKLYRLLKGFLETHLLNLANGKEELMDEELLEFYSQQWVKHQLHSKLLSWICSFFNR